MCQILIVSKWITNILWTNFPTIRRQILISIHNHPHYFFFSEYLLQIFVTVCRSTLVYICKLFLCLLYLILILRNLHPASLFHSVNKRLTYCQKDLVLTHWFCFRLKVIWLPSPLGGVSTLRSKPFHFCILFSVEDPLIFRPNWGLKGWKNFFSTGPPPYLRVWMTATPPPLRFLYWKVWIRLWFLTEKASLLCTFYQKMVPLSYVFQWTLHPFSKSFVWNAHTREDLSRLEQEL